MNEITQQSQESQFQIPLNLNFFISKMGCTYILCRVSIVWLAEQCPLKDFHVLISRTHDYVIVNGKADFADRIKLRVLKWGDCPGLSRWV